jgi:hypothetical protein
MLTNSYLQSLLSFRARARIFLREIEELSYCASSEKLSCVHPSGSPGQRRSRSDRVTLGSMLIGHRCAILVDTSKLGRHFRRKILMMMTQRYTGCFYAKSLPRLSITHLGSHEAQNVQTAITYSK